MSVFCAFLATGLTTPPYNGCRLSCTLTYLQIQFSAYVHDAKIIQKFLDSAIVLRYERMITSPSC